MIHATVMALRVIRGDSDELTGSGRRQPEWVCACDGQPIQNGQPIQDKLFSATLADAYLNGHKPDAWPTCPKCLVLLDQALEEKKP